MQVAALWHVLFAEDRKPFGIQLAFAAIALAPCKKNNNNAYIVN